MFFMKKLFKTKASIGFTVDTDRKKFDDNLNIIYKNFTDILDDDAEFVTMVRVLEHFTKPLEAIDKLKSVLKRGGYAYIEVPSLEWVEMRIEEKFCPVHISYFSYKQLIDIFTKSGFTIIKSKESKYWGNIKLLVRNNIDVNNENYNKKILKIKLIKYILYPIFRLIKTIKTVGHND